MYFPPETTHFADGLITKFYRNADCPVVYHYTSTKAAISILKRSLLYVSSVQNMNGPFEIRYSLDLLKDIASIVRADAPPEIEGKIQTFLQSYFVQNVEGYVSRMYLFSSTMEENQYIWDTFYSRENFVCLEIGNNLIRENTRNFVYHLKNGATKFTDYSIFFGDVLYENREQQHLIRRLIQEYVGYLHRGFRFGFGGIRDHLRTLRAFVFLFVCLLKDSRFSRETEYRWIIMPDPAFSNTKTRTVGSRTINYIELFLSDLAFIRRVIIMPDAGADKQELVRLCNDHGIDVREA